MEHFYKITFSAENNYAVNTTRFKIEYSYKQKNFRHPEMALYIIKTKDSEDIVRGKISLGDNNTVYAGHDSLNLEINTTSEKDQTLPTEALSWIRASVDTDNQAKERMRESLSSLGVPSKK